MILLLMILPATGCGNVTLSIERVKELLPLRPLPEDPWQKGEVTIEDIIYYSLDLEEGWQNCRDDKRDVRDI